MNDPAVPAEPGAEPEAVLFLQGLREDRFPGIHELLTCGHEHEPGDLTLLLMLAALSSESPDQVWPEQELLDRFFHVGRVLRGFRLLAGTFEELGEGCTPELALELASATLPAEDLDRLVLSGVPERPDWYVAWRDGDRFILLFPCGEETWFELRAWRGATP